MSRNNYQRFSAVTHVDLLFEDADGALTAYFDDARHHPIVHDEKLRSCLRSAAAAKTVPVVYQDGSGIYYAAMQCATGWMYLGPMCSEKLNEPQLRQYYRSHGIEAQKPRLLRAFSPRQIADIVLLAAAVILGIGLDEEEVFGTQSPEAQKQMRQEQTRFVVQEEEENDDEAQRHSYYEETLLMQAVREGRTQAAVHLAESMDDDSGRLSSNDLNHWRNLAIIGISLCARAAIEGGMPPEEAYRISGYYIQRCEPLQSAPSILRHRNRAIEELTTRVSTMRHSLGMSNYTAKCKDYVRKHYREKIYLEVVAEGLGISPTYLSRLFRKETGVTFQEFVNQVRVSRAADLLAYTDMDLDEIAVYVHFPSQSYFGKMFRRYRNITPKGYRDRYQAGEFIEG